jgi:hypothetical protein
MTPACERPPVVVIATEAAAIATTHKTNFRMTSSSLLNAQEGNAHAGSEFQTRRLWVS